MADKEKKTKREEYSENKDKALENLDLAIIKAENKYALYFHAENDPPCFYRMAASGQAIFGLINKAVGKDLMPTEQDALLTGITRHVLDPENEGKYLAKEARPELVLFKNGIYDLQAGEWLGNAPELLEELREKREVFTCYVPHNYNPDLVTDKDRQVVDRFFTSLSCGNAQVEMLLYQMIGYCFYRHNRFKKALLLKGAKGCGKSTYLDMVRNIIGADNTSSLSLHDLSDKFSTIELAGKLANIGDELDKEYITTSAKFKSIVSGGMVSAQKKYGDTVGFIPYAKMMFAMNGDLRMDDPGNAVADRLIQIPFPASLRPSDIDPFLGVKLATPGAIQYVTETALESFRLVLESGQFQYSEIAERTRKDWECYNNPIQAWLEEFTAEGNTVIGQVDGDLLFNKFNPWVKDQQMRVQYSLPNFRQELLSLVQGLEVGTRTRYRENIDGLIGKEKWGYKLVMNSIAGNAPTSVITGDDLQDPAETTETTGGNSTPWPSESRRLYTRMNDGLDDEEVIDISF